MSEFRTGVLLITIAALVVSVIAGDKNHAYSPCRDTTVQRHDGFTLGLAFAGKSSFYSSSNTSVQLSPCDKRLSLSNAQLAVFRPKVDEISLLTVNSSTLSPESYGAGYMVAFAGSKYAARSPLAFVANGSHIVTSFTLVVEFKKGRLNNLYWKRDSCASCKGNSNFVCLNGQDCAIPLNDCKSHQGKVDCSLGIQLAFSGTDKHYEVLNSWYEVSNLRQYSLFGLYSNLKNSLSSRAGNGSGYGWMDQFPHPTHEKKLPPDPSITRETIHPYPIHPSPAGDSGDPTHPRKS